MSDDGARRLRRPSWRDPRLGVGVLLVAASVAVGSWAVARADRTMDVLVAAETLAPGDRLADVELRPQAVRPDGLADVYLPADAGLPADAVVTRVVGAGELLPAAAVGTSADVELRPVVVALSGTPPSGVVKGASVDLWVTPATGPGQGVEESEPPRLLAERLVVADLLESDSLFAAGGRSAVQVLVDGDDLPAVLGAVAGEADIVVVPVPGGGA